MTRGIKKASRYREASTIRMVNYMVAVLDLSLQHDLVVPEQQDLPFAHFFFLPLPVSAKLTPVISKAAVANNNTFFIIMRFIVINQRKNKGEIAECQLQTVKIRRWR